jgi:CRP-like cAMP-binding protein
MLDRLLRRFDPFADLDWPSLATLAQHARLVRIARGRRLTVDSMRRGDCFLVTGRVRLCQPGGQSRPPRPEIGAMSVAGRAALSGLVQDGGVIETLTPCTLLWVDAGPVAFLLHGAPTAGYQVVHLGTDVPGTATEWSERFLARGLDRVAPRALKRVFDALRPVDLRAGEAVLREGEPGTAWFVIAHGATDVIRAGRRIAQLRVGDTFGEDALLSGRPRNAAVKMAEDGRVMRLPAALFYAHLAPSLVPWISGTDLTGNECLVRVDGDPRAANGHRGAGAPVVFVGGDPGLRALWTFIAVRAGAAAVALAEAPDQAGTVRPAAQALRLSIESARSTESG